MFIFYLLFFWQDKPRTSPKSCKNYIAELKYRHILCLSLHMCLFLFNVSKFCKCSICFCFSVTFVHTDHPSLIACHVNNLLCFNAWKCGKIKYSCKERSLDTITKFHTLNEG